MQRTTWNRVKSGFAFLAFLSSFTAVGAPATGEFCEVRYELLELGALNSFANSSARAVSNRGHVTGNSAATTFLWSCDKGMEDIGQSIGRPDNVGIALNERDQVIVYAAPQYPQVTPDVFLWERGQNPIFLNPDGGFFPDAITETGFIVHADRLWSKTTGLTTIDVGIPIYSSHLTNLGRLSGVFFDETTFEPRIYTWTRRDGLKDLGSALGESVFSMGINDRGDLLLDASSSALRTGYIMDRKGTIELLPIRADVLYLYPIAMNLHREVIGVELTADVQPHGDRSRSYLWSAKRGFLNLDELLASPVGSPFVPASINDWGWIAGDRGFLDGALLIPVPANIPRFENLNRLEGPQLCRALNQVKLHRLLCSIRE